MVADERSAAALELLRAHALDRVPHSAEDLLAHLQGTYALLRAWGAREALALAGLSHSVFGTEMFGGEALPASLREALRARIGDEAARLVWLFGVIERRSFTAAARGQGPARARLTGAVLELEDRDLADLAELYAANAVEQLPRLPRICALVERELLSPCAALLSPAASEALATVESADEDDVLFDDEP
ncbi:MAG: hypothetical protein KC486_14085 [Myxococcales bacterium]|nr:hypothetical protein [Myxococcales bacterium]